MTNVQEAWMRASYREQIVLPLSGESENNEGVMFIFRSTIAKVSTALAVTSLLMLGGTSAAVGATESHSESRIAEAVASAPKNDEVAASSPGTYFMGGDGGQVTLPDTAGADISFRSADGVAAGMSVPISAAVETQLLDGGSARAIVAIEDATQPDSYIFELDLPDGVVPQLEADGSVTFGLSAAASEQLDVDGVEVAFDFGGLAAPWAVDAEGAPVETHYTLDGTQLTQHVDFDADSSFPIIADPEMEWKGYYATLTYTASETLGMRDQGVIIAGMLVAAGGMAAFGPPGAVIGAAMVGIGAASVGIIAATAANAVSDGRCLSVDVPSMMPSIIDC